MPDIYRVEITHAITWFEDIEAESHEDAEEIASELELKDQHATWDTWTFDVQHIEEVKA